MDQSNFDIIKCGEKGCNFWHILVTEGFKTTEEAQDEINKIIQGKSFYSCNNFDEQVLELINTIANDIFEIRKIITDRPQSLTKGENE